MLQLKNMSCGYGAVCAVSDLSLSVTSGSIFALIGANGAGKTSTIMSIAGHVVKILFPFFLKHVCAGV